jgi:hypothetical protein
MILIVDDSPSDIELAIMAIQVGNNGGENNRQCWAGGVAWFQLRV